MRGRRGTAVLAGTGAAIGLLAVVNAGSASAGPGGPETRTFVLPASTANVGTAYVDLVGGAPFQVTLPRPGRYLITADLRGQVGGFSLSSAGCSLESRLYTTGGPVGGSERQIAASPGLIVAQASSSTTAVVDGVRGQVVSVQARFTRLVSPNANCTFASVLSDADGRSALTWVRLD